MYKYERFKNGELHLKQTAESASTLLLNLFEGPDVGVGVSDGFEDGAGGGGVDFLQVVVVVVDGVDFVDADHVGVEEGGGWVIFFGGLFVSLDFGDHAAHG